MKFLEKTGVFIMVWLTFFPGGFSYLFPQNEGKPSLAYEIWVELDHDQKMLTGKENITWKNTSQDEVEDMWFHLYYNAFKNEKSAMLQESKREKMGIFSLDVQEGQWGWITVTSLKLENGKDLTGTMEYIYPDGPLYKEDETVMRVTFPEPVLPGKSIRIQMEFSAKIPSALMRSGFYRDSYFIAQWFPKPGVYEEGKGWNCHAYHLTSEFFADFADYTVHITVPGEFIVGASGNLSDVQTQGKKITYTYQQDWIHDFAWTASPRFIKVEQEFLAGQEVSEEEYEEVSQKLDIPVDRLRLKNVKMILLILPEHKKQTERHFAALKAAIKYYGLWFGPYPYETITMVDPPFRTGSEAMEYPTLFTAGTNVLLSKEVLSPEGVIIHEFGHQYWYGLCANNEFEEAWLDEGINTYSTGKVLEAAYGKGEMEFSYERILLNGLFGLIRYFDYEMDRFCGIQIVRVDPVLKDSWKFLNGISYEYNVYQRASACLNTLERLVGSDTMLRILRSLMDRFKFRHVSTQDFIDTVNMVSNRDLTWFFDEFFFSTAELDYGISSLRSYKKSQYPLGFFDAKGQKELVTGKKVQKRLKEEKAKGDIFITEAVVRRYGDARIRGDESVVLEVVFQDGSEERISWDGQERWSRFQFEKTSKAAYAQIDPENIWLIDSNLTNNSMRQEPERKEIRKLSAKLFFWVQNIFLVLSSLT